MANVKKHSGKAAGGTVVLALLCCALCAPASADTMKELARQASTPWRETIETFGRTLDFDVTAQLADAAQVNMYRVTELRGEERKRIPNAPTPEKRRGIAYRTRPSETYTLLTLPQDYHAFGNPITAQEAIAAADARLAPVLSGAPGTQAQLAQVTAYSPEYVYNKNTGEWGGVAVEGDVGSYKIEYQLTLDGVPLFAGQPFYLDGEAYLQEGASRYRVPYWNAYSLVEAQEDYHAAACVPVVQQVICENVALAPLDSVWASLRALAQEGYLREVYDLRLSYTAFCVDELTQGENTDGEYLMKPVWVASAEAYEDPAREATNRYGEIWKNEVYIFLDAQTGELIERSYVTAWPT